MSNRKQVPGSFAAGSDDDAFVARTLEFSAWARANHQLLLAIVVVIVAGVVGVVYLQNSRERAAAAASQEFEEVAQLVEFGDFTAANPRLEALVQEYAGTPFALEGRLLMGQVALQSGDAAAAIAALEPGAADLGEPLGVQVALLLGAAYEAAERWDDAVRVYLEVASRSSLDFQIRNARADAARIRSEQGDAQGAISLYRQILDSLEEGDPARGVFELRIGELGGDPSA